MTEHAAVAEADLCPEQMRSLTDPLQCERKAGHDGRCYSGWGGLMDVEWDALATR